MQPRVLVSHPGRQHTHQLVYALQEGGYLSKFITSIWYKPNRFPYRFINLIPPKLRKSVESELRKRYYEKIDYGFIEQFAVFEMLREGFDRLSKGYKEELGIYLVNQIHDWYVSRRIEKIAPNMVIGYETSSSMTFKKAKGLGVITILDLAQVHYRLIDDIRQKYQEFDRTFDSDVSNKVNRLKEEELSHADYIITLSNLVKESLISCGISESKIYLANLGFNPAKFKQKESYRKNGAFKILYVGTIKRAKGIHLLLEAYRQLNLKDTELIFIGGMSDGRDVLSKYEGMYRYIPYLDHDQLVSYYQDADVFVFPSYLDSWGMVVIEAMACGTPIIVSENTGAKEAVIDGICGFITPVGDVDTLKEKILYFHNNRDEIECFGKNARKRAENYSWENYREGIREIILKIYENANAYSKCLVTNRPDSIEPIKYEGCPDP
ncbi:MAG: hypothetical protein C4291_06695 [Candidatus Dadabacteria bacterium]